MATPTSIRIKEGVVSTDPYDYARAIKLIRRDKLLGLWIRPDLPERTPGTTIIDLSLLDTVSSIEDFGISPDVELKRISNFDAIYRLSKLKKLALHTYKRLDLSRFPNLQFLALRDTPGAANLEKLTELRSARIWKLRADDLSILADMHSLSELWIVQTGNKFLRGMDSIPALSTLTLSHCSKLESIGALPETLVKLTIEKCPHLGDLSALAGHPSLEFLAADVIETLSFVPRVPRLSYVASQNVVDGDLGPILKSATVQRVGLYPNRKHYSPPLAEVEKKLAAKKK